LGRRGDGQQEFVDLKEVPEKVTGSIEMLARNGVHLATLMAQYAYPRTD